MRSGTGRKGGAAKLRPPDRSPGGTSPGSPCGASSRCAQWPVETPQPKEQLAVSLPQHPDEHRPQHPILLAVDQQLGEGAALRVAPELADPVGSLEVGEHQDVEQLGAGEPGRGRRGALVAGARARRASFAEDYGIRGLPKWHHPNDALRLRGRVGRCRADRVTHVHARVRPCRGAGVAGDLRWCDWVPEASARDVRDSGPCRAEGKLPTSQRRSPPTAASQRVGAACHLPWRDAASAQAWDAGVRRSDRQGSVRATVPRQRPARCCLGAISPTGREVHDAESPVSCPSRP